MKGLLESIIPEEEQRDFREFLASLSVRDQKFLLRNDIILVFEEFCDAFDKDTDYRQSSGTIRFLRKVQELFVQPTHTVIMHRHGIARYRFYQVRNDGDYMEEIDVPTYLDLKDRHITGKPKIGTHLHMDFQPFYDFAPSIRDTKKVGNGIRFLSRHMCAQIFQNPRAWKKKSFEFVKLHKFDGQQLLVNESMIPDFKHCLQEMEAALEWLGEMGPEIPFKQVEGGLKRMGFEPGWGHTVGRIIKNMEMLTELINEPTDAMLERFLSRVTLPLISKIAIVSPHGWFGQENVLGKPDTGGQVIYILDQVRALERYLQREIALTGVDVQPKIVVLTRLIPDAGNTSCDQKHERIHGTDNGWILRIPFRDAQDNTVRHWMSRFHIWPYLERFAEDAETELRRELEGRPDLIIGNYSDGNLVATLLSDKMDVIQCTIAHALEKTKYLFSDLYWQEMDNNYHFSLQYTADILSMNKSDFIITSTTQEIVGTEYAMGQYESYQFFSMPRLYQVISGINLFAPKFNVIPPGVDEDLYFSYSETDRRIRQKTEMWEGRLFTETSPDIWGVLENPDKTPIFTMARFDKIKNITGLIEAFGMSERLQEHFNLIFAAGTIHLQESNDAEEQDQIRKAYELIEAYNLQGSVRWLPSIQKLETGEVYRVVADRRGLFVQPALFEAFGLTILEAMASGLTTFATQFGGPQEIIQHGESGFLLNTSSPSLIARGLEGYLARREGEPDLWDRISIAGIRRVQEHFTWHLYSERLINLAKVYGFWRYTVSAQGKIPMDRYCEMIYHFLFKERAWSMES
jgi:sucrose synthase